MGKAGSLKDATASKLVVERQRGGSLVSHRSVKIGHGDRPKSGRATGRAIR